MAGNSELEASPKKKKFPVVYNDPIHGTIELHLLLNKVINTPEFYRLKNIKQLGGLYCVYPGATHSRFEHSIGVCYIAGEFARMLQQNQPGLKITPKEVLCVEMAGLCHDLGHGPFSHMFEKSVMTKKQVDKWCTKPGKWEHEDLSKKIFQRIYKQLASCFNEYGVTKEDADFIEEMIHYDADDIKQCPQRRFLYEIVANEKTGVDVDKWDYFARDCHYIGMSNPFDWRRTMKLSRVIGTLESRCICFRDKEVGNIYDMFRTRSYLHTHAYQHKTGIAVEHMMSEAIRLAGDSGAKLLYVNGDSKSIKEVVSDARDKDQLDGYVALTDSILQLIINANLNTVEYTYELERKNELDELEKKHELERKNELDELERKNELDELERKNELDELERKHELASKQRKNELAELERKYALERKQRKNELEKAQMLLKKLENREIFHLVHTEQWKDLCDVPGFDEEKEMKKLADATGENSSNFFMQKVVISYGDKDQDPVKKVHFYSKQHPDKVIMKSEILPKISELIVPKAFQEIQLRLYRMKEKAKTTEKQDTEAEKIEAEEAKEAEQKKKEEKLKREFKKLFLERSTSCPNLHV